MGDGYVLGTATEAGLPLNTPQAKAAYNKRLRAMGVPLKLCGTCMTVKHVSRFAKASGKADGLNSKCRDCVANYYAKYRAENREARREYDAKWRAENAACNANRVQDPNVTKRCRTCGEEKPETAFSLARATADGLYRDCKDCDGAGYRRVCRLANGDPENTVCHLCGLPNDADAWVDHLHPQSLADEYSGDIHESANLRWAHPDCNISRGNKPLTDVQLARIYGEAA